MGQGCTAGGLAPRHQDVPRVAAPLPCPRRGPQHEGKQGLGSSREEMNMADKHFTSICHQTGNAPASQITGDPWHWKLVSAGAEQLPPHCKKPSSFQTFGPSSLGLLPCPGVSTPVGTSPGQGGGGSRLGHPLVGFLPWSHSNYTHCLCCSLPEVKRSDDEHDYETIEGNIQKTIRKVQAILPF